MACACFVGDRFSFIGCIEYKKAPKKTDHYNPSFSLPIFTFCTSCKYFSRSHRNQCWSDPESNYLEKRAYRTRSPLSPCNIQKYLFLMFPCTFSCLFYSFKFPFPLSFQLRFRVTVPDVLPKHLNSFFVIIHQKIPE